MISFLQLDISSSSSYAVLPALLPQYLIYIYIYGYIYTYTRHLLLNAWFFIFPARRNRLG